MASIRVRPVLCALVSLLAGGRARGAERPLEWRPAFGSTWALLGASKGTLSPLLPTRPEWSRRNLADVGFLGSNPALLGALPALRPKFVPLALRMESAGNAGVATTTRPETVGAALEGLERGGAPRRAKTAVDGYYLSELWGLAMGYRAQRTLRWQDDGSLLSEDGRDFLAGFGAAGEVLAGSGGRLTMGAGIKAAFRQGNEVSVPGAAAVPGVLLSAYGNRSAFGLGMDIGFVYDAPRVGDWGFQFAGAWRDLGNTSFSVGGVASTDRRFRPFPNDLNFGLGFSSPKFWDGFQGSFRVEYGESGRQVSAVERLSVSTELRLPWLASLTGGFSGSRLSGGVAFRFPYVELEIGSAAELWGEGAEARVSRSFIFELRGVM